MLPPRNSLYIFVNVKGEHLGTFFLLLVCRPIFNFCSLLFFFSMLVNCKVPDWLPLRLVSLIYPKNRKNTVGNKTGQVQVQYISPTYSGRIFSRHKEGIVSGNAGHLLLWRAHRRLLSHHQALQWFASSKPQMFVLSLGEKKKAVFFCLPPLPVKIPFFKVELNCLFLGKLLQSCFRCDFPCIFL